VGVIRLRPGEEAGAGEAVDEAAPGDASSVLALVVGAVPQVEVSVAWLLQDDPEALPIFIMTWMSEGSPWNSNK